MAAAKQMMIWSCLFFLGGGCAAKRPQIASDPALQADPTTGVREACHVEQDAVTCPPEAMEEHLLGVISLWELAMAQSRDLEAARALAKVDVQEAKAAQTQAEHDREVAELQKWAVGAFGVLAGVLIGSSVVLMAR